jgi:competence protein ComEA
MKCTAAVLCLLTSLLAGTAPAQQQLPEGPGQSTMKRICSPCHSAENVIGRGKTREEWGETVGNMVERGARGTDEEFYEIVDYLVKYFPKSAASNKVYVNRAGPKELERELQLTTNEAEAVVRYRGQHGDFKTFDDLKKVPGLDAPKLETKKERLAFS